MTRDEWIEIVQVEQALWPHASFPPEVVSVQYEFVKDVPHDVGLAALKSMAARDYPPNSAQIALAASELVGTDTPDFDEVRAAFRRMLRKGRFSAASPPVAIDWTDNGAHELLAGYFDRSRWRQWCLTDEDDTTFYAQQRDEYRTVRARYQRTGSLEALGVNRPALLREGLHQLDPSSMLGIEAP